MLGEFDRRPVVFYLLKIMHVLPQSANEADTDQLLSLVEDWFLASPDAEVLSFTHPCFPGDDALFRRARSILSDHSLKDWVFSMNICKGLAPVCRDVAMRWNDIVANDMEAAEDLREWERDDLSISRNRKYFKRWRNRMGIKIGKIQTREYMSRLEISDKVVVLCLTEDASFLNSIQY